MKIMFLTRLFYPHTGGVEKHISMLSKELQKAGHTIIIITELHTKGLRKIEEHDGIKIYRIPIPNNERAKKLYIWMWIIKNRSLFNSVEIVHAHDIFYWLFPIKILLPSKKIFTTFHGYEGNISPGFKQKLMHKLAVKFSNKTISIGKFYKKWYGTESDIISYGAVSPVGRKVQRTSAITKISFIGRLESETGIDEYVGAISSLVKKITLTLEILGDGKKRKLLEDKVREEKLPVSLHGWVEFPEKKIVSSDIIFTSRYLGILESLAQGKFVIAIYNNSIKKDYLQMTPFAKYISIVKNSKEVAEQVMLYLKNPKKYSEMIMNGQAWALEQTWEKIAKEYIYLWS